jgi:hypothetical protein
VRACCGASGANHKLRRVTCQIHRVAIDLPYEPAEVRHALIDIKIKNGL